MIQGSCSYENICYLRSPQQSRQIYIHLLLRREEDQLLITTKNATHKHSSLIQREFSFSRPRIFVRDHTGASDLKGVLFSVFLAELIGSVQSSVAENSHHNMHGVEKSSIKALP